MYKNEQASAPSFLEKVMSKGKADDHHANVGIILTCDDEGEDTAAAIVHESALRRHRLHEEQFY